MNMQQILKGMTFDLLESFVPANTTAASAYGFTYSFVGAGGALDFSGFGERIGQYVAARGLSGAEKDEFRETLAEIASFANVTFTEVGAGGDLKFGATPLAGSTVGKGGPAISFFSQSELASYYGFAAIDSAEDAAQLPGTVRHEIGHAMGLEHPHENSLVPPEFSTNLHSIMSYEDNPERGTEAQTFQILDVFALQQIWGANDTHLLGNTVHDMTRGQAPEVVWDAGGFDAIRYTGGESVEIQLRPGWFSRIDGLAEMAVALGARIEKAIGGSNADLLVGNGVRNVMNGRAGDDELRGLNGNDKLVGAKGADILKGGNGRDVLLGGGGADLLEGNKGNDVLKGGGGADLLEGGRGRDVLFGGGGDDVFVFHKGMGTDIVRTYGTGVDVVGVVGFSTGEVSASLRQDGADAVIQVGANKMIIVNTDVDDVVFL